MTAVFCGIVSVYLLLIIEYQVLFLLRNVPNRNIYMDMKLLRLDAVVAGVQHDESILCYYGCGHIRILVL